MFWYRYFFSAALCFASSSAFAIEVNGDGQALIQQAAAFYARDIKDRPVVTDPNTVSYINGIAIRLVPEGKSLPTGVQLDVTVVESPKPELYSYMDGHIVITTGLVFAVENEAQLAAALSHEVAHVVEGHYIELYQTIKAAERREAYQATAGAIFGSLLDVAVDYAANVEQIKQTERLYTGESTYFETTKRMAQIELARGSYHGMRDVIANIPEKDQQGNWLDPRQRFEAVADTQGMEYLALAGYDTAEAARAWRHVHHLRAEIARERERLMGVWASQRMSMVEGMMRMSTERLERGMEIMGLVQTISEAPNARSSFVAGLVDLKEIRQAHAAHGKTRAEKPYRIFLRSTLLPRANKAMGREHYLQAYGDYRLLYEREIRTAPVVYGLAKSSLGDFAFSASETDKKEAERLYRQSAALDVAYALPYRGLGELYEDWERYADAIKAYQGYLKRAPKASDRKRIAHRIKMLKKKASR